MKKSRHASIAAAAVLSLAVLAGCSKPTVDDVMNLIAPEETPTPGSDITFVRATPVANEPLCLTYGEMDGAFCPFWASKDGDTQVVELTQLNLLAGKGQPSPSEITALRNEDGSTTVHIRLMPGLKYPDETPLSSKDLLFTYYVLCDVDYDGPSLVRTTPIRGLSEYWSGMDMDMFTKYVTVYGKTYNEGKYDLPLREKLESAKKAALANGVSEQNLPYDAQVKAAQAALDEYDSRRADEIRDAIDAAWKQDSRDMVAYTMENYGGSVEMRTGLTLETVANHQGLQVMYTMLDRGLGTLNEDGSFTSGERSWDLKGSFPTFDDLYSILHAAYDGDAEQYWKIEGVGRPDMLLRAQNTLVRQWAPEDPDWRGAVDSIAGFRVVDDLTLEITLEYCDDTVLRLLTDVWVAPLHFYGDRDLFRTETNSFGFARGDLSAVRAHIAEAYGAGEYVYRETDFRTVYFDPNQTYWLGESQVPWVELTQKQ